MKKLFYLISCSFIFTSCVEIIDDLSLNFDGSGTFKYVVNLSESKTKINTILALDSLDGKKVPSLDDIKTIISEYKAKLEEKEGISNVKVETNYNFFILKFQCDFNTIENLQKAIREIAIEKDKKETIKELNHEWLTWEGNKLIRSVPNITTETTKKIKKDELENLKKGSYTSITRFDRLIEKCDNPNTIIPASKTVCAIKTTPFALIHNVKILENTIYLTNIKKAP